MDPLLRAATLAVITTVALGGLGGVLTLRAWLQLAAALAIWGAFGGVLISFLAIVSWWLRVAKPATECEHTAVAGVIRPRSGNPLRPTATRHAA